MKKAALRYCTASLFTEINHDPASYVLYFCYLLSIISLGCVFPSSPVADLIHHEGSSYTCATCEYLQEQHQRIQEGRKPIIDPQIVPEDYWSVHQTNHPQDVNQWPRRYFHVAADRTDSDGDGLVECRVKLAFDNFVLSGAHSPAAHEAFTRTMRRCLDLYNRALQFVGLEFKEVADESYHILLEATTGDLGASTGLGTMHGAFGVLRENKPVFYLRANGDYAAMMHLLDDGAPAAVSKNPPGNPYVYVFSPSMLPAQEISMIMLHELGHLLGLEHPFTALENSRTGKPDSFLIDWLAWDRIGNPPPAVPSTVLGGEDFVRTGWSRGFLNSFMTYDDQSSQALYPDLPPPIKAFIAHYYGIFHPASAQLLLDQAIDEHVSLSPVARGEMDLETEPNNHPASANPVQIGRPILAAISSGDGNRGYLENYQDPGDWYAFTIDPSDAGRTLEFEITIGSFLYENYYNIENGYHIDGDVWIVLTDAEGNTLLQSAVKEFPSLQLSPATAGQFYLFVGKPEHHPNRTRKDYVLRTRFADGGASQAPTFTPLPSATPVPSPVFTSTPIAVQHDYDLVVEEFFFEDYNTRERITHPRLNQELIAWFKVKNTGRYPVPGFSFDLYLNGQYFSNGSYNEELPVGWTAYNGVYWRPKNEIPYTVEWHVNYAQDQNQANNVISGMVLVGNAQMPTPTVPVGTATFTPIPPVTETPVPTSTPLPTSTWTATPSLTLTPTFTFTPSHTPSPEVTPVPVVTSTPTGVPEQSFTDEFHYNSLEDSGWAEIAGGFLGAAPGKLAFSSYPFGSTEKTLDNRGLVVTVEQGEITLIYLKSLLGAPAKELYELSLQIQTSSSDVSVALAALDGNLSTSEGVDGSIAVQFLSGNSLYMDEPKMMSLLYQPIKADVFTPIIQIAGIGETATVWIDSFSYNPAPAGGEYTDPQTSAQSVLLYANDLDKGTPGENSLNEISGGFLNAPPGVIRCGSFEPALFASSRDHKGLAITVKSGEVSFINLLEHFPTGFPPAWMRIVLRANAPGAKVSLVGIRGQFMNGIDLDGSMTYISPADSGVFMEQEKALLVKMQYPPLSSDDNNRFPDFTPIIQVDTSTEHPVTVWIDRIEIFTVNEQ